MTVNKDELLFGVVGLLLGGIIAGGTAVLAVNNNDRGMMQMMGMHTSQVKDDSTGHMGMSMDDMAADLTDRKSDDFDKNFVAMMIVHHQGAIDMAKLAESRAKHDEIKQLSKDIITAQTKEISEMKQWQQAWDYDESSTNSMHMH